jgi:RNA polymerase sigma-70 factor (ECF subfamily)
MRDINPFEMRAMVHGAAVNVEASASDREQHVSPALDFDSVYTQNVRFVWRVLRGMGVPDGLVEDAVQDIFVVVHRRLPEFDGRHSVRTWLFAIAYRVSRDHLRRARRSRDQELFEHRVAHAAPMPEESAARSEALRVVSELLDQLDDDKRIVLLLADVEGMTAQEIAAATGVGINTIYTRLRRARLELNHKLAARQKRTP